MGVAAAPRHPGAAAQPGRLRGARDHRGGGRSAREIATAETNCQSLTALHSAGSRSRRILPEMIATLSALVLAASLTASGSSKNATVTLVPEVGSLQAG